VRILVTGATGLVGREVCRQLGERGVDTVAAVRRPDAAVEGGRPFQVGDIDGRTRWESALEGVDAVIHIAGLAHQPAGFDPSALREVNVAGTRRLAKAAATVGVGRIVFLSSAKVMGERTTGRPVSEADPPAPQDEYARSKLDAEWELSQSLAGSGTSFAICRTALVYGPGVKANFLGLMRAVEAGVPLPFGALDNSRSLIYVGNLADALITCCDHSAAKDATFLVADDPPLSTPQLIRHLAAASGRRARLLPVPPALMALGARFAGRPDLLTKLLGSFVIDSSSIRRSLGWQSRYDVATGMRRTVAWYRGARQGRAG
jgi:nucleoside-diphosphate-sugar epimerase